MSRKISQFSTSTRTNSASSSTGSSAAGNPGVSSGSGTCSINIEEDNELYGKVVWANCCVRDKPSENCPPQTQLYLKCPVGFFNCADPSYHLEMCTIKVEPSGYTDSRPLNKKCCPKNFSCGVRWESPCELLPGTTNATAFPPYTSPEKVISNALHLKRSGVFAGCNDANLISSNAVGGIVAISIIGLCLLCAFLMWIVRRNLLRDPRKPYWFRLSQLKLILLGHRQPKVTSDRRGKANVKNLEITVMKECQVEEKSSRHGSRNFLPSLLPNLPLSTLWIDIGDAARMSRIAATRSANSPLASSASPLSSAPSLASASASPLAPIRSSTPCAPLVHPDTPLATIIRP